MVLFVSFACCFCLCFPTKCIPKSQNGTNIGHNNNNDNENKTIKDRTLCVKTKRFGAMDMKTLHPLIDIVGFCYVKPEIKIKTCQTFSPSKTKLKCNFKRDLWRVILLLANVPVFSTYWYTSPDQYLWTIRFHWGSVNSLQTVVI